MSMNLEKQVFRYDPEHFIAGTNIRIATAVKTAGEAIGAHAPVVLDTTTGKLKKVTATTTGSGDDAKTTVNTEGLYGIVPEAAAADEEAVVYLTGEFFADSLELPENVTAADIEVALRNLGIFLK